MPRKVLKKSYRTASDNSAAAAASDVQVQLRMSHAMHDDIRKRAYLDRRSISAAIRILIEDGLKLAKAAKAAEVVSRRGKAA